MVDKENIEEGFELDLSSVSKLLWVMAKLRDPENGCPWDIEQTFKSVAAYTIEEAYEVVDAIEHGNIEHLEEELGDLLLQVVFHARIAEELDEFNFSQVAARVSEKMIRRHPHVFGGERINNVNEQSIRWENEKSRERNENIKFIGGNKEQHKVSALDGVITALPALSRAEKLQKRAARVGFDWDAVEEIISKIREELCELESEIHSLSSERLFDEVGDLLFTCVNLARRIEIDPEAALRSGNIKFERRFRAVEEKLFERGECPENSSALEMNKIWDDVKHKV